MKRKPKRQPKLDSGAKLLQEIAEAQAAALGHGGLTYIAGRAGITVSHMRKRLRSPKGAFDPATCKITMHILATKTDKFTRLTPIRTETIGRFQIDIYDTADGLVPAWRPAA